VDGLIAEPSRVVKSGCTTMPFSCKLLRETREVFEIMNNLPTNLAPAPEIPRALVGVILAGGKSSRYGRNKAFVRLEGVPLIERVSTVMGAIFERLLLVTNPPEEYAHLGIEMVGDLVRGVGPLGGIHTALKTFSGDAGFFVACDMPYLCEPLVRRMIELLEDYDAVVPRVDGMAEPLHSFFGKGALPVIEEFIRAGRYQIVEILSRIKTRYVEEETLRGFDPRLRFLANVNRPEDVSRILGGEDRTIKRR
jgi:molybdenum cofactor guanylyltransferase